MMDDNSPPPHRELSSSHPPPKALTNPEVLRTIGLYLTMTDLQSCRLVSHLWHTDFSPFMYWLQLEDLDGMMRKIEKSSPTSPGATLIENYQSKLNELEQRVKQQSAAFHFHSARREILRSGDMKSRRSFLYIANLIRTTTQSISYTNVDHTTLTLDPQKVMDEACLAVEGSRALKSLDLLGLASKDKFYRWSETLETITEMDRRHTESEQMMAWASALARPRISMISRRLRVPLWPQLESICLSGLRCDPLFIRTLLSHAPALRRLTIVSSIILTPEETQRPLSELKRVLKVIQTHDGISRESDEASLDSNANVAHSSLEYMKICKVEGVYWKDVLSFARRLPQLTWLSWEDTDGDLPRKLLPAPASAKRQPQILRMIDIISAPLVDVVRLVNDCKVLTVLRLGRIAIDLTLVRALSLRAWTLTQVILTDCTIEGADEALIVILCSVFTLRILHVTGAVMKCDPLWLRAPWVCKGLVQFSVRPKCDGGQDYTADMAQEAFMAQVATLSELCLLNFGGGVGANGFHPEKSLYLLKNLKKLDTLDLRSPSAETGVVLTQEHAELMVSMWPKLKLIIGLPKAGLDPFRDYVRQHRPEVDTTSDSYPLRR